VAYTGSAAALSCFFTLNQVERALSQHAEAVTRHLMDLLDIRNKEEQSIGITDAHIKEIREYLSALKLIVDCPIETADPGTKPVEHILFTQPRMRYCQAQALSTR